MDKLKEVSQVQKQTWSKPKAAELDILSTEIDFTQWNKELVAFEKTLTKDTTKQKNFLVDQWVNTHSFS